MSIIAFHNGKFVWTGKPLRVEAVEQISNEDWKTALAFGQRQIKPGETGYVEDVIQNFYGFWAYVQFDEVDFRVYASFDKLKVIEE